MSFKTVAFYSLFAVALTLASARSMYAHPHEHAHLQAPINALAVSTVVDCETVCVDSDALIDHHVDVNHNIRLGGEIISETIKAVKRLSPPSLKGLFQDDGDDGAAGRSCTLCGCSRGPGFWPHNLCFPAVTGGCYTHEGIPCEWGTSPS